MKKLLLFTTLLSASFVSFCPALRVNNRRAVPAAEQAAIPAAAVTTAKADFNKIMSDLLHSFQNPNAIKADVRLENLITKTDALVETILRQIGIINLEAEQKVKALEAVDASLEETKNLLELYQDNTRFPFQNKNISKESKLLVQTQQTLNSLKEQVEGVSATKIATRKALRLMWKNKTNTAIGLLITIAAIKAGRLAHGAASRNNVNPFSWILEVAKWTVRDEWAQPKSTSTPTQQSWYQSWLS